jgi:ABC-type polysaccharide/polyol phosphate transport system ATPase subunit
MLAIDAQNLGKAYRMYRRPSDRVREWIGRGIRHEEFWALREVDLVVRAGEAIGVIGENGAGKSTLLGLLTGTTRPTTGHMAVHGTVAAILELGAGFHPEFTGRENARMHAALFARTAGDPEAHLAEVLAFSELGDFIDKPVRTYSSGMYVRLAFALAVTVDPDVLIIDEALAVGDQHFQTKCVDRITRLREAGRTILFCSHNMYQVKKLCDRAVWLKGGRPAAVGPVDAAIDAYLEDTRVRDRAEAEPAVAGADALVRLVSVTLEDGAGAAPETVRTGDPVTVRVCVERHAGAGVVPGVGIAFVRNDGLVCYCVSTEMDGVAMTPAGGDRYVAALHVPRVPLLGGGYYVNVATTDNRGALITYDIQERLCPFRVRNPTDEYGLMRMEHRWLNGEES